MDFKDKRYQAYLDILKEELLTAMGCTEPIAIAYAAAKAREVLGCLPDRVEVRVSDNIIKNAKSVVVPNTGNLRGIEAATAAGIAAGNPDLELEVISEVDGEGQERIRAFLADHDIKVTKSESDLTFDICVALVAGEASASVRITQFHTHIVEITKNGEIIFEHKGCQEEDTKDLTDRTLLNVVDIYDFARTCAISDVETMIQHQIDCNMAIAEEGIRGDWGANVGSVLLESWGQDVKNRARAMAAAGSDARMSGCELPVVIVSGSGNQGLTASVPVIAYARALGADRETLFRALVLSDLVTIHQKTSIGRLSAYCGAVSAGAGAGAGICLLHGGSLKDVVHTIVNALAIVSGIICDGAKPSCAGKIASAVEAGILGYEMYKKGQQFYGGDGIVTKGVENTIVNVGRLASRGMRETDREILNIMLGESD